MQFRSNRRRLCNRGNDPWATIEQLSRSFDCQTTLRHRFYTVAANEQHRALAMPNSTFLLHRNHNEPLYIAGTVTNLRNQCQRFQGNVSINTRLLESTWARAGVNVNLFRCVAIKRRYEFIDPKLQGQFLADYSRIIRNETTSRVIRKVASYRKRIFVSRAQRKYKKKKEKRNALVLDNQKLLELLG